MKKIIAMALMSGVLASPAWALFETNKQLASTATVTLEDAVRHALKAVPVRLSKRRSERKTAERSMKWRSSMSITRHRRCMSMRRVVKRKSITRWSRACRPPRPARTARCIGGERP